MSVYTDEEFTPKDLGYRMPAEWEPHQGTWLSWPHKEASWPGKLHKIWPVFAQMVAALTRSETVHVNVNDQQMEEQARRWLEPVAAVPERLVFHRFPPNDAWCRDCGALFVLRDGLENSSAQTASWPPLAAVDFEFNSWGCKYPPFDQDNALPAQMAAALNVPLFRAGMVLEGGSIDVDGQGTLLTTESCLLNPNRNPTLTREDIERRLNELLNVEHVVWLAEGIVGDDTDGHVDDLARFVSPGLVVTAVEPDVTDENHEPLQKNLQRLKNARDARGRQLEIVTLPMPPAVVYQGERLPATYLNFYIANTVVLLPGYHSDSDKIARQVLSELFPDREVVQIDCTDLIWGLGAFHCLTQQVPA